MNELPSGQIEFVCGDETSVTSTLPTTGVQTQTGVIDLIKVLSLTHQFTDTYASAQYSQEDNSSILVSIQKP